MVGTNIKLKKFLKENTLQVLFTKFDNDPELCTEYLVECRKQLKEVIKFFDESLGYYETIANIKNKEHGEV
tara:strand:- start:296 stop:508 length:213 start_codon:yes stop_codon:yes gene_type:complete